MRATLRLCRFRPRMASLASCLLTPARSARSTAVTFAFILGIPAILGGSVLELGDALHSDMELDWVALGIGFVIAAVVGILSIKLVSWLAERACDLATVDADKLKADIQGFEEKLGNLSEDDARRAYLYNEIAWCKLKLAQ